MVTISGAINSPPSQHWDSFFSTFSTFGSIFSFPPLGNYYFHFKFCRLFPDPLTVPSQLSGCFHFHLLHFQFNIFLPSIRELSFPFQILLTISGSINSPPSQHWDSFFSTFPLSVPYFSSLY